MYILFVLGAGLFFPILFLVCVVKRRRRGRLVVYDVWTDGREVDVTFEEEGKGVRMEGRVGGVGEGVFWLEANKGARTWRTETARSEGGKVEWGGVIPLSLSEIVGSSMCLRSGEGDEEGQSLVGTRVANGRVETCK